MSVSPQNNTTVKMKQRQTHRIFVLHPQFGSASGKTSVKVKLSPKSNLGFFFFFCECIWVKPSCKSKITMKEALLRFSVCSFWGQTHFQWECYGRFYNNIKISIFKTVRRLDTTWNSPGSLHMNTSTEFNKKKESSSRHHPASRFHS